MEELPNDMFQEIYKYLTQSEILNMLMLNRKIYELTMRYIDSIYIYNRHSNYKLVGNINIQYFCRNMRYYYYITEINNEYTYNDALLLYLASNNYIIHIIDYFYKFDTIIYYRFNESYGLKKEIIKAIKKCIINAAEYGYINIIKFLIERYNIKLDYALEYACKGNHIDIVKLILNRGEGYLSKSLRKSCEIRDIDINIISLLIKSIKYVSNTALYNACLSGNIKLFRYLVKHINETDPYRFINIYRYETLLERRRKVRNN